MKNPKRPCIYILTNWKKTVVYVGVSGNLSERVAWHHANTSPNCFTTKYRVHYLIYFEYFNNMTDAIHREDVIKGWIRDKKNKLIAQKNPDWIFLNPNKPEFPILTTKEEESIPLVPQQRGHFEPTQEAKNLHLAAGNLEEGSFNPSY